MNIKMNEGMPPMCPQQKDGETVTIEYLSSNEPKGGFRKEIEAAINRNSMENGSDTPDFILANYLADCLHAFDSAVLHREKWYGRAKKCACTGNSACSSPCDRDTQEPDAPNAKLSRRGPEGI